MSKKQLIISITSIIILALIGGGVLWYWYSKNQTVVDNGVETGAVVESNYEQELEELESSSEPNNNDSTNNAQETPTEDGGILVSKQVGEYTVFYNWYPPKEHNDKVTVYLDDGSSKTVLFQELAFSIGGSRPEFQEVVESNIALLTFGNGDSGWFQNNYHYINVSSKKVISIKDVNLDIDVINITDHKQSWEVSIFIENECKYFEGDEIKIRDGENSYLVDITLNGKATHVLTEQRVLTCVDPGGIGSGFLPNVSLQYVGVSKDLSKVFFYLISTDTVELVFDIDSQTVLKEAPHDLVQ
ncbi:MAG: hypothetical protein Q8Q23_00580 [bacterium]|nr:hypothetical protein [bacterium]